MSRGPVGFVVANANPKLTTMIAAGKASPSITVQKRKDEGGSCKRSVRIPSDTSVMSRFPCVC
jgi:hypothetical protein